MTMSVVALKMRKWTVLGAALAMILAASSCGKSGHSTITRVMAMIVIILSRRDLLPMWVELCCVAASVPSRRTP
jgi:hypothetical protein